ncbi:MAG: 16S rRNA (cytosine(1402)-N(4))-methyltransferase RsmH [Acidobacteriia bacterium]|nr:16S rRNA (cytosine(1402)-N(4))-methyltransferase RsmH [Terriglobia bacterium]
MHTPVMLSECLEYLALKPDGVYLDATAGLGGHTGAIARQLAELGGSGRVLACDRDRESLELAKISTADVSSRIRFHQSLFSKLGERLTAEGVSQLDGLLADLGVSRYQLTDGGRGFSLMADGPLDMRMGRDIPGTAADIVNFESEKELADLIFGLGEERRSRRIARAIVRARPIKTTGQLAKLIEEVVPRTEKIHPATRTFMALRIAVNRELEELDALLESIPRLVKPGGRAVIVTFMSLEDRKVKHSFQALAKAGQARLLTRHVVRPAEEEIRDNPPSRSAKLRALELL